MSKFKLTDKNRNAVMFGFGFVLFFIGMFTSGLWPFQLPFCLIGGGLMGLGLSR